MPRELFVYWKVERARGAEAQAKATLMQQSLRRAQPALLSRLMRRAEETGDKLTFMETYSALPGGVTPALQAAIEAAAAGALASFEGLARHVEVFERLDPPD
ncbi:MAG: DUF4936 family protein [Rubrivivax sp.]|nr:DUF4936 family protein [Rubrivivax sp.]